MTYQHLRNEIDNCKGITQSFLNYKRGDCTFDDFIMYGMEHTTGDKQHARDFFESLRDKKDIEGSNGAIAALMDYDSIFEYVIASDSRINETEADHIYAFGSRYFSMAKQTLVI